MSLKCEREQEKEQGVNRTRTLILHHVSKDLESILMRQYGNFLAQETC